MQEWTVSLNGGYVDTVFYDKELSAEYVKDCLVFHDGFNSNIVITKVG